MGTPLVMVGGAGFGREALDVVEAHNVAHPDEAFDVLGVLDDGPSERTLERLSERGIAYLGRISDYLERAEPCAYVLGIGAPAVRERLVGLLDAAGWWPITVVHPRAGIGSHPHLGEGVVVCAGVQVSTNVRLGRHVHLNPNCTIGHDAVLSDFVSVNPAADVSGEVFVGTRTLVGAGAIVLQGLTVGEDVVLGAGTVVTRNVPAGAVAKGIPGAWR